MGAVMRYLVGKLPIGDGNGFPVKTFLVNIIGCFIIGLAAALAAKQLADSPRAVLFLKVGICGGFTTFSSFALETGEAFEAVKEALNCENLTLAGLHCHIGSQIFDIAPFEEAAKVMLGFIAKIKAELGYEVPGLNLGGGFGIKYMEKDDPQPFEVFLERVSAVVKGECEKLGLTQPFMYIEPGRSIAAPAGLTLYTVGARKEIPNIRTYISVNGGMADSPRYILYKSEYEAIVANKANEERTEKVTIAGKCCESGDLIGENMSLQHAESGDIIAVCATGAYNYSMSSNYNRLQKPAVVFVNKGTSRIAVKRETLDDIIRNDV